MPPPPAADSAPRTRDQLTGAWQHLNDVSGAEIRGFEPDPGRQERETRERTRTDLQSHTSTSFDVSTNAGYEQASAYVRYEMHRNHPLSLPVYAPTFLPPINLPEHMESRSRSATVSNITRRVHHERSALYPMPLVGNRTSDTPHPFPFEYPVTPINDENDPGSIMSDSRRAPSSNRSSQRRPLDRVPLSQLDDSVEENDDRYLNEMLPPSHRQSTSTSVIVPQGSPAEVEAMLMATSSDEDEPQFDSRNARRRQFRTQSPAMVMRTRITGEQQALSLSELYSRQERHSDSPLVPGGRPGTPVGPPLHRQPPLELHGAGTPVLDVEMQDTSPVRVDPIPINPFVVPPSPLIRDPHGPFAIQVRRRRWYPQEDPDDLPPLEDIPLWPVSPASPHHALNRYMTSGRVQAAWDALWDDSSTGPDPYASTLLRNVTGTQPPGSRAKEYARPAGKSIREWIEEREMTLAGESRGSVRPAGSVTVEEVPEGNEA